MAEELRDAFAVLIDLNTWMDADTKERARQKLHHLQMNIGSPPWIKSDRDLDEYYKDMDSAVSGDRDALQSTGKLYASPSRLYPVPVFHTGHAPTHQFRRIGDHNGPAADVRLRRAR
ncbi:hypothetical protein V5799_033758 [Amblyomma americanum]|uniref:Peptidase M13 N-terminal domain-containing protein n=1 Tax=Amblyomma americanum TaxID=6943 RepID=A0AAQ4DME2_AMBAM